MDLLTSTLKIEPDLIFDILIKEIPNNEQFMPENYIAISYLVI